MISKLDTMEQKWDNLRLGFEGKITVDEVKKDPVAEDSIKVTIYKRVHETVKKKEKLVETRKINLDRQKYKKKIWIMFMRIGKTIGMILEMWTSKGGDISVKV